MLSNFKNQLRSTEDQHIGKKLGTASLNSKFNGSYEEECTYGIIKAEYTIKVLLPVVNLSCIL